MLLEREAAGRPVTVGLIGAGKFGTMFLAQARRTRGLHVVAVADLDVARALSQLRTAGWDEQAISAPSLGEAFKTGRTHVTPDAQAVMAFPAVEVIVEATGVPPAGIRHARCDRPRQAHRPWSTSGRTRSRGRCSRARPGRGGGLRAWHGAIGPRVHCEHVDWARLRRSP
jgi:threonine dehydrogenase-like Zn-dependent dehydrogenase